MLEFTDGYQMNSIEANFLRANEQIIWSNGKMPNGKKSNRIVYIKENNIEWTQEIFNSSNTPVNITHAVEFGNNGAMILFVGYIESTNETFVFSRRKSDPGGFSNVFKFQLNDGFIVKELWLNSVEIKGGEILLSFTLDIVNNISDEAIIVPGIALFSSTTVKWSKLFFQDASSNFFYKKSVGALWNNNNISHLSFLPLFPISGTDVEKKGYVVTSIDPAGDIFDTKKSLFTTVQSSGSGSFAKEYFKKKNDLLFSQFTWSGTYEEGKEPGYYSGILSDNLSVIRSERLENGFGGGILSAFAVDDNGTRLRIGGGRGLDSAIFMAAYDLSGRPIWQKGMPLEYRNTEGSISATDIPGMANHFQLITAKKATNKAIIRQLSPAFFPEATLCENVKDTGQYTSIYIPVEKSDYVWEQVWSSILIEGTDIVAAHDAIASYLPLCEISSLCTEIRINDPPIICSSDSIYTFNAHRNNHCAMPVKWTINSNWVSYSKIIDDTTLQLKFLPEINSPFFLKAALLGCSEFTDEINLSINFPQDFRIVGSQTLCKGDSMLLMLPDGYFNYKWNGVASNKDLLVRNPGKYIASATNNCGTTFTDTIEIKSDPQLYNNHTYSFTKCTNDTLHLAAPQGYSNYQWSNNEDLDIHQHWAIVGADTIAKKVYEVSFISAIGCSYIDSFGVTRIPIPEFELPLSQSLCQGDSLTINLPSKYDYTWSNGANSNVEILFNTGIYVVEASDGRCAKKDSINIVAIYPLPQNFLLPKALICEASTLHLQPLLRTFVSYLWSTGDVNSSIIIEHPGSYSLTVTDDHDCTATETIIVTTKFCKKEILFPSAFTPNGDGLNDYFAPIISLPPENYRLKILNRWGQTIFQSTNPYEAWNGSYKGAIQANDIFVWVCEYRFTGDQLEIQKGILQLIK